MGFLWIPNLLILLIFDVNILGVRAWLVTDHYSNHSLVNNQWMKACLLTRVPILINRQGIKEREESERVGAIIFNISVKGGR